MASSSHLLARDKEKERWREEKRRIEEERARENEIKFGMHFSRNINDNFKSFQ